MADRKALLDQNETPEDVATLYTWANLHGAKYRDFSASRAQTRERARQRVQEAIETERRRRQEEAEIQEATGAAIVADAERKQEAAQKADLGRQAAQQNDWPPVDSEPQPEYTHAASYGKSAYSPFPKQTAPSQPAVQVSYSEPIGQPFNTPPAKRPVYGKYSGQATAASYHSEVREDQMRGREEPSIDVRNLWTPAVSKEPVPAPAWLSGARPAVPVQPVPAVPEGTLQASRDRLRSRWFALNSLFLGAVAPAEAVPAPAAQRAPVLAVFSLAGGVGKTSLVATLGRTLSARGERVLLVDTATFGMLPFFFGARDQRPGVLRTFTGPGASGDAPIQLITIDPETLGPEVAPQDTLTQEISRYARTASRVIVDLATASGATTRRILRLSPTVLVPVIPDLSSVVSVSSIDAFFEHNLSASGQPVRPYYILNRFDPTLPLHLDVREVLREQLGDRLLPFTLRRTPAVSEALAEGMTVVDYAPSSTVAEDFGSLASWVKSLAAPATQGYRGVRWSER